MSYILQAEEVSKSYQNRSLIKKNRAITVLDKASLKIREGETFGLVGASGCGKSTLCRLLLGLERADSGSMLFRGNPFNQFKTSDWCNFRRNVQLVFQDSIASVNPRQTIGTIIGEPLEFLSTMDKKQRYTRVCDLLERVGLEAADHDRKPGRMSGGQLQRVCIARALSVKPALIALDESLSSLDSLLQGKLITLLEDIQKEEKCAYLFITHDLRLIHRFCTRVSVMDGGKIVEEQEVLPGMHLHSSMGRALQNAILPALPVHVSHETA